MSETPEKPEKKCASKCSDCLIIRETTTCQVNREHDKVLTEFEKYHEYEKKRFALETVEKIAKVVYKDEFIHSVAYCVLMQKAIEELR